MDSESLEGERGAWDRKPSVKPQASYPETTGITTPIWSKVEKKSPGVLHRG
jgi:hypothetical protein